MAPEAKQRNRVAADDRTAAAAAANVDFVLCPVQHKSSSNRILVDNTKCQTHKPENMLVVRVEEEPVCDSEKNYPTEDADNENDCSPKAKRKQSTPRRWLSKSSSSAASSTLLSCIICNLKRHHSLKHQPGGQHLLGFNPAPVATNVTTITTNSTNSNPLTQPAVVVVMAKDSSADHQVYVTHLASQCDEKDVEVVERRSWQQHSCNV